MKKGIIIAAAVVLAAGAIGGGSWYYFYGRDTMAVSDEVAYVSSISSIMGLSNGTANRYAGVVEAQETVDVKIESGRKVTEVQVKTGDVVSQGQLLFEYDLTSIQEDLQEAKLELDQLKNEAVSLTEQIATLENDKKKASADSQLSYTIEIETNRLNLQKNEYNQTSKQAEIEKLQNAMVNTEVRSEIDGIIQKIDNSKLDSSDGDTLEESGMASYYSNSGENSDAFITILSTGAYRVKGSVNEQNQAQVMSMEGQPVIIRSRVDEDQIWYGTMGAIDKENASTSSGNSYYGMIGSSDDAQTSSSTYPFYVALDDSEGLMLGQHVYIESDIGQMDKKDGLWLSDFYIVDADQENPYVWAANENGRLEKRSVILGNYDDNLLEYEIVEGLEASDKIAFPTENLVEGMQTVEGDGGYQDIGMMDGTDVSMDVPVEDTVDMTGEMDMTDSGMDMTGDMDLSADINMADEISDLPDVADGMTGMDDEISAGTSAGGTISDDMGSAVMEDAMSDIPSSGDTAAVSVIGGNDDIVSGESPGGTGDEEMFSVSGGGLTDMD